jgi:3-hydroxybutyryl-CoA dehydrogenase
MDLIGNDINYAVSVSVYNALGKPPRLEPSESQKHLVDNNKLGRKSGGGFYSY